MHEHGDVADRRPWGVGFGVVREKLDIAQYGEIQNRTQSRKPKNKKTKFAPLWTKQELELVLRSGIGGDPRLRALERQAQQSGLAEDLIRYWHELRRQGKIPALKDIYRVLRGTANGRPNTKEAELARRIFRDILLLDPTLFEDSFPLLIRNATLQNNMPLEELADLHPRSMEFIKIEASKAKPIEFLMGSPENEPGRESNETRHPVRITKSFEVGATNVTVGLYRRVMGALPPGYAREGITPRDDEPLRYLSWNMANDFIKKLNELNPDKSKRYRMLTEAEWELANRLNSEGRPTQTAYPWGDTWEQGQAHTTPRNETPLVDTKEPIGLGFAGMNGEVWQWVNDLYAGNYGISDLTSTTENPRGPEEGVARVLRGGSVWKITSAKRSASRNRTVPDEAFRDYGLRLAREDVE